LLRADLIEEISKSTKKADEPKATSEKDKPKGAPEVPPKSVVLITYKEKKEVKQELRMLAAMQGHGSVSRIVRLAVDQYLNQLREAKKAATA